MPMCYVKCIVEDGLIPSEKFVQIKTLEDGIAEVAVPSNLVSEGKVKAFFIGREDDRTLIEFPRESSAGKWRAWIDSTLVLS
jgi:hypothetical protein